MSEPESPPVYQSGFDKWAITKFRPFAKAWFEFVRNLLVVSVFIVLGRRSTNLYLFLLTPFTYLLFLAYCLSYLQLALPITSKAQYRPDRMIMNLIILLFTGFFIWRWSEILPDMMESLINLQTGKPN